MGKKNVTTSTTANTVKATKVTITEEKDIVRDRIGELVDLNKCPVCTAHTDCFGNINGKCTALNDSGVCKGQGCAFYKNREQADAENKAAFRQLLKTHRYDLINKYGKQLSALGAMDDEVMNESIEGSADFEAFADADYQKQLEELSGALELTDALDLSSALELSGPLELTDALELSNDTKMTKEAGENV